MKSFSLATATAVATVAAPVLAQTFQRLGACPDFGCVFPPDQSDFIAGQYFDIRVEVHNPINGTEGEAKTFTGDNSDFSLTVNKKDGDAISVTEFFSIEEPELERWNFTWYEDLFALDEDTPSLVEVVSKAYRRISLTEAGEYEATLTYNGDSKTVANWVVRDFDEVRKTHNVLMFIGDGMTTNMITAARLIGHKSKNGKYQSSMALDKFPVLGHQMTHSIDSFITDSANSATSLYSGHKTTVNCLGVYADSSPNPFDDPKFETVAEMFSRIHQGHVGIVSKAYIADATPAGLTSHTRDRGESAAIIDTFLNGITNYTWTEWDGPDVLFGGGAENFFNSSLGGESYEDKDYYAEFANAGYNVVYNAEELEATSSEERTLGIFSVDNMATWLDSNVYTENLEGQENAPDGSGGDALDQPGLKQMTLKAIDILENRAGDNGWFIMSEAASIDKQMHRLDYDRALGELLELDDTVKASMEHLEKLGCLDNTLVLVTADHGHGFDVAGSVDTKYLQAQTDPRKKRNAVGVYERSGLSEYANTGNLSYSDGTHFPSNWDPRYTLFSGTGNFPDKRENFAVRKDGQRTPAIPTDDSEEEFIVNPEDGEGGFELPGNLPLDQAQGVHSLTDVPVFATGPCASTFGGVYDNTDVFFRIANCLGLTRFGSEGEEKVKRSVEKRAPLDAEEGFGKARPGGHGKI